MQDAINVLTASGARNGGVVHKSIDFTTEAISLCYDTVKTGEGGGVQDLIRVLLDLARSTSLSFEIEIMEKKKESAKF